MADESGSRGFFGRRKRKGGDESEPAPPEPAGATPAADEASIAAAAEREAMQRLAEAEQRAGTEPSAPGSEGPLPGSEPPPSRGAAEGAEELRKRLGDRIEAARGIGTPPIEAEPPRPIEDRPPPTTVNPAAEFVPSAEHEAEAAGPGELTDALAGEIAADIGAVEAEAGEGSAAQLERAESVIAAREQRFDAALQRARERLEAAEARAGEAEQRAQRAKDLTAFQERERRQAEELREVLDRISAAEERARQADARISDLIDATVAPPELESLLSGELPGARAESGAPAADFGVPTGELDTPVPPLDPPAAEPEPPAPPLALAPDPGTGDTVPGLAATESSETDPATSPPVEPGVPEPPVHLAAAPDPVESGPPGADQVEPDPPGPGPAAVEPAPPADSRIDLNEASSQDLRALGTPVIGIGRILAERERRGGFGSIDDLDQVKGLDPDLLARLKAAMRVGDPA